MASCFSRAPNAPVASSVVDSPTDPYQVTLEIAEDADLIVSVSNRSDRQIVFAPRADFVVVFHEAPDGTRTALTWDGSNAEMRPLSPLETVNLAPKSTYTIRKEVWVDRQHKIDRSWALRREGKVYAVVMPLRIEQFEPSFRTEAAKWVLLGGELRSNTIKTPRSSA